MPGQVFVRPYQDADRHQVIGIAADTAYFGEPVENFLDDRQVFIDAFVSYYLDFEAEYAWVACADDRVVGYLTGCVDTRAQRGLIIRKTIIPVVGKALRGKYQLGRRTWRHAFSMLMAVILAEYPQPELGVYPAHLHINVSQAFRGRGLGRKLIESYLAQIRSLDVPGVHLGTTSFNVAACRLYEAVGFKLIAHKPTRVWNHLVTGPVENLLYGMRLDKNN